MNCLLKILSSVNALILGLQKKNILALLVVDLQIGERKTDRIVIWRKLLDLGHWKLTYPKSGKRGLVQEKHSQIYTTLLNSMVSMKISTNTDTSILVSCSTSLTEEKMTW